MGNWFKVVEQDIKIGFVNAVNIVDFIGYLEVRALQFVQQVA